MRTCFVGGSVAVVALALVSGPGCRPPADVDFDRTSADAIGVKHRPFPRFSSQLAIEQSRTVREKQAHDAALSLVEFEPKTCTWKMKEVTPEEKASVLESLRSAFLIPAGADIQLSYGWHASNLERGSSVHESQLSVSIRTRDGSEESVGKIELGLLFAPLNNPISVVDSFEDSADTAAARIEQRIERTVLNNAAMILRWNLRGANALPTSQRDSIAAQLSAAVGLPRAAVSVTNMLVEPVGLPGEVSPSKVLATVISVGSQITTYCYAGRSPGEFVLGTTFAADPRSLEANLQQP